MSLKKKILSAQDLKSEIKEVPEWDVRVEVRAITAKQRSELYRRCMRGEELDWSKYEPMLLTMCLYDPETGDKIFDEKDGPKLMDKSAGAVGPLVNVAFRLNGMARESFEEAEKN